MDTYYVDGEFVSEDQATVSVKDLSVLRGYGVFDFLRSYNGIPFHLMDHIIRLQKSARLINMQMPYTIDDIYKLIMETIERNNHDEFNIRIILTGGVSPSNYIPSDKPKLFIMVTALTDIPKEYYTDGVKVTTSHIERFMPGAKSINYIPAILAMKDAADRGAVEALYVDRNGNIQEGTTSNFFAIIGNKLITPPAERLLPGITRKVILELAEDDFEIEIRNIHKDEVSLMDEAFITASNKEVMPVHTIDSTQLTEGVGKRSGQLMQLFNTYTANYKG